MPTSCAAASQESRAPTSVIHERARNAKRAALSAALGKSDTWASKVIDGECGVMLNDLPGFLRELGLRVVGIELNPAYAEMARRRIAGDAPLLAEVA